MNKVQHFEIPADDINRARKFYAESFGWNSQEWPMPGMAPYIGLHTGPMDEKGVHKEPGFINGGMFERGKDFPVTGPTIAVVVDDIMASLEKVKLAGGTVFMEAKNIGGMGLYAYVKDTEGNVVGIWQDLKVEK